MWFTVVKWVASLRPRNCCRLRLQSRRLHRHYRSSWRADDIAAAAADDIAELTVAADRDARDVFCYRAETCTPPAGTSQLSRVRRTLWTRTAVHWVPPPCTSRALGRTAADHRIERLLEILAGSCQPALLPLWVSSYLSRWHLRLLLPLCRRRKYSVAAAASIARLRRLPGSWLRHSGRREPEVLVAVVASVRRCRRRRVPLWVDRTAIDPVHWVRRRGIGWSRGKVESAVYRTRWDWQAAWQPTANHGEMRSAGYQTGPTLAAASTIAALSPELKLVYSLPSEAPATGTTSIPVTARISVLGSNILQ